MEGHSSVSRAQPLLLEGFVKFLLECSSVSAAQELARAFNYLIEMVFYQLILDILCRHVSLEAKFINIALTEIPCNKRYRQKRSIVLVQLLIAVVLF